MSNEQWQTANKICLSGHTVVAATAVATFIEQQIKKMETIHHGAFEHDIFVFGERYHELWQHIEQPFVIFV